MTRMDHISSRFRRSKKATQSPATVTVTPSSELPPPDGTKPPPAVPTVPQPPQPAAAASLKQPQQHESPPVLTIATTTPPSSSHSTQSNLSNLSNLSEQNPHNGVTSHGGIGNTLRPPKSPFRGYFPHFRSNKRARSPAPASLAVQTSPAVFNHDGTVEHEMIFSPSKDQSEMGDESPVTANVNADADADDDDAAAAADINKPKVPAFLALSEPEIYTRFQEITWQERHRLLQAANNPSPNHQYARLLTPEVRSLDRYANIQPWANNRVRLQVPDGSLHDYINASPIVLRSPLAPPESRPPLRYIAMQGPKFGTTDHAWRMVAEQLQSPAVIVMLTETHEMGMEKCYPYFPRGPDDPPLLIGEDDEFGDGFRARVECAEVEERAGGAIEARRLTLTIEEVQARGNEDNEDGGDEDVDVESPNGEEGTDGQAQGEGERTSERKTATRTMTVWHLLYRRWPDFGVPALEDIGSFFELMRLSRELNASDDNPRIIHCSAGVGRSGTFMALEHLMREVDSGDLENYDQDRGSVGDDLVFGTVNALREQRRQMVQAEPQFLFIYTVLRKLWMDKYGISDDQARARAALEEPAAKRLEVDHDPFVESPTDMR